MRTNEIELILVRAQDDAPLFSAEYQTELRQFASQAHSSSQRCFTMDSATGGGGSIGEFIFNNAPALITAVSTLGVTWLTARFGRKLRLRFDGIEIEANNLQEVEAMLAQVSQFRGHLQEPVSANTNEEIMQDNTSTE